ncbi:MarR family winged helix-turn-helix transcriptional regulator [Microbacterium sp. MPKO10]|uniref:MarR family winged helix-turn-helix transcriptional regulator n=1 Tax=Microbacterium sp. MPKO10 TaxID=2989818 RepID=UPI002236C0A0|nr:MarR family transcriptional regulator [Microbacterium sp. MPKO10]MCW4458784.1 MarR family transcriptional regulator [Microbacterium sp. MPKO10]
MIDDSKQPERHDPFPRAAFLLAQVGTLAGARFAQRLEPLALQPSDVGILRLIATEKTLSQQGLAGKLGVVPSRVVVLIDALEKKGLVARERSARDRRTYVLRLTNEGRGVMREMREIGSAHEAEVTAALTPDEHHELGRLLGKIAADLGLTPNVHPGYKT